MSAEERELGLRERSELARRRGVISGKEFIQRVKAWAADPDTNPLPSPCFVKGVDSEDDAIDLRGLNCERPLNLRDFCFLTTVDLRDARVAGPLDLRGSTFLAGLRLGCCRLEGGLDLSHCWIDGPRTFGAEAQAGPAGPVDLHGAIIEGSLVGNALQVRGSIDAESMRVKANCELSGLILGFGEQGNATKNTADLVFRGARIEGQLVLHRANIEGQLNLQSARIDLDLFIRRGADEKLRIGTILATFAQSGGDFDVDGAEVSGEVNVLGGRFGRLFIEDCQIGTELVAEHVQSGNVVMTNLLVEQVRLSSSSLSGDLNWNQVTSRSDRGVQVDARGLSLDNLYMSNSSASELFLAAIDAVEIRISDTTATEMTLSNARLSGDLFLTNVSSLGEAGTVIYARGLSAHNIFIEDGATGELNLASANVLGDFIWRPRNIRHCPVRRLDAGNLGVGGYCVLDAVQCDGVLDFSKARLGALRIRCYPTQEDDVDSLVVEPSTARSLVGRNMVVDGDVELYGLQVGPGESIANKEPGTSRPDNPDPDTERDHTAIADGVIDLSNAEIRGDLKFWSHELASQLADSALSNGQLTIGEGGRSALYRALCGRIDECLQKSRISRYLRLAGTEVRGNLVLTGLRVGTGAPAESDTDGLIDLADAEIRRNVDTRTRDRTATTTLRTACRRLSLRGMRCSGDLYLQRLSITQPSRLHTHESAIDGQRVRVDGGGLFLCDGPGSGTEGQRIRAELPGQRVSFYDGRFSRIVVNGRSFDARDSHSGPTGGDPRWPRLRVAGYWAGICSAAVVTVLLGAGVMAVTGILLTLPFAIGLSDSLTGYFGHNGDSGGLLDSASGVWVQAKWWVLAICSAILVVLFRATWRQSLSIRKTTGAVGNMPCELPAFQDIPIGVLTGLCRAAWLRVALGLAVAIAAVARFVTSGPDSALAFGWIGVFALAAWVTRQYLNAWVALGYTVDVATVTAAESVATSSARRSEFSIAQTFFTIDIYLLSLTLFLVISGMTWLRAASAWSVFFIAVTIWIVIRRYVSQRQQGDPANDSGNRQESAPECESRARPEREQSLELGRTCLAFKDFMQVMSWNGLQVFPPEEQVEDVSFAQVQVGHLEIVEPIPRLIDFQNLRADRWSLNDDDPGNRYLELLDHASSYNSAIYSQIEQDLRRHGRRELAENVHRAMRQQEQWRERRWLQTALMLVHSLIGYGTQRGPLIRFMFLWFIFTTAWIAIDYPAVLKLNPETEIGLLEIEPDGGNPREAAAQLRSRLEPQATHHPGQRIGRSLALAVRYHVPIIAWDPWPYVVPKGSVMWMYTSTVMIIHWVLWPLLLASLLQTLIPQREN